jgi:hypothetical protein
MANASFWPQSLPVAGAYARQPALAQPGNGVVAHVEIARNMLSPAAKRFVASRRQACRSKASPNSVFLLAHGRHYRRIA